VHIQLLGLLSTQVRPLHATPNLLVSWWKILLVGWLFTMLAHGLCWLWSLRATCQAAGHRSRARASWNPGSRDSEELPAKSAPKAVLEATTIALGILHRWGSSSQQA
jgi:hypothetical protein